MNQTCFIKDAVIHPMSVPRIGNQHRRLLFVFTAMWGLLLTCVSLPLSAQQAHLVLDEQFTSHAFNIRAQWKVVPQQHAYDTVMARFDDWPDIHYPSPLADNDRLWLRARISNMGDQPLSLTLVSDRTALDYVHLVLLDGRDRITDSFNYRVSRSNSLPSRLLPTLKFPFVLQTGQSKTLLLSVKDNGLVAPQVTLWENHALAVHDRNMVLLFGVAMGTLSVLLGYFLISYLYQRTPARFWLATTFAILFVFAFVIQGGLVHWPALSNQVEAATVILLAAFLAAQVRVCHTLFPRIPLPLRVLTLLAPLGLAAVVLTQSAYQMTLAIYLGSPLIGLLIILSALLFRDRRNPTQTRTFLIAWLFLFAVYAVQLDLTVNVMPVNVLISLQCVVLMMLAMLSFAFSIEVKEKNLNIQQLSAREKTITQLNQFYDLFRNSAEGLYTSTLDGELRSINPAMCALFGYEDEDSMLREVENTRNFYASKEDRDLLVGEILEKGAVMGREIKGIRADGSEFWFSLSCQIRKEAAGTFLYGSIFDVTERKQSSISLEYLATHDSLTGVFNRREFEKRLYQALDSHSEHDCVCLLYLDLDRFKVVNDTCGHKAGDALIKDVATLFQDTVGNQGDLARLGGDEFAILVTAASEDDAYLLGVKILNALQSYRFVWENRIFSVGVSIGLVGCGDDGAGPEQYLSMADAACYIAKEQGRNQIHRYSSDDDSLKRYEAELDSLAAINEALEHSKFTLFYQHCRPLHTPLEGDNFEILLRLEGEEGELIPPNAFLPSAERYNLMPKIDRWVVENSFRWLADHPDILASLQRCSINLSGQSLGDRDLKLFILNAFETYSIPYHKICFEITETVAIIRMDDTRSFMHTFQRLGCEFSLDDFGSGFSSYTYLKHLPVNSVKIDGSFIKDMLNDPVDAAMVASIKDVAKALGMKTVGEFVENEATMSQLGRMGVDFAQGYGVARPAPLKEYQPL
ncbi:EAL domain-containing protein [Alteromonas sp. ASW11-19]|uniref:EAL domain-containing protein n=1 Tax=Alteromonas salexigens TaxID=2982530 RepID=A0ABT2VR70_9ALTE|nr:EAL domain-containing protein [Alteromonas salexigens]MCU7554741.1 EAL domain-containing protein [Alteromonas salexigens]